MTPEVPPIVSIHASVRGTKQSNISGIRTHREIRTLPFNMALTLSFKAAATQPAAQASASRSLSRRSSSVVIAFAQSSRIVGNSRPAHTINARANHRVSDTDLLIHGFLAA